jgi:hypothetical protein
MKKHFKSMQSLRFIMFLLIFLNHINDYSSLPSLLESMLCRAGCSLQAVLTRTSFVRQYGILKVWEGQEKLDRELSI